MDIDTTKLELVKTILSIDNNELIQKLADFLKKEKVDFWDELSENQKNEISRGINELDQKKRVSYDAFLKKFS